MSSNPNPNRQLSPGPSTRIGQALRRYFITGLATLFPVTVTIWLVVVIFNFADSHLLGRWLGQRFPGLGILATVVVILLVGVFSVHFFGRVVFQTLGIWLSRLPVFKKIYPATKQLAQFLFQQDEAEKQFRGVVLVEYPRAGAYCIAFVTNETQTTANGRPQTLLTLVLPNPPSPFTGPVIFVPKEDAVPLDMKVEDAVKLIVSFGVVTPPFKALARSNMTGV